MNRRKMLAGIGALLLAIVSTAALVKYVKGAEKRAVAGEELTEVLVVKSNIKAGTSSADLAQLVTAEQVQVKVKAEDAVTNFAQIDGLVTSVDLVKGEQLLTTRFVNPGSFQGARSVSVLLPEGANEVTFKLAPERAVGGQLRPGDLVSVVASFESFDNETVNPDTGEIKQLAKTPNTSHILLNKVVVVRIQFPDNANTSSKEKNGVSVAPTQDLLVTLAVDQPSLEQAVFAAEFGKVWLSYEPKSAIDSANAQVVRGNVYDDRKSLFSDVPPPDQAVLTSANADPTASVPSPPITPSTAPPTTKKK